MPARRLEVGGRDRVARFIRLNRTTIFSSSGNPRPHSIHSIHSIVETKSEDESGLLTIDERDDLAGGTTDLAQGTSGVGKGRSSGSRDLGETL
jgi:hypothetical protein